MKIFIFTGARSWENSAPVRAVLKKLAGQYGTNRLLVVEGGAPGLDTIVRHEAPKLGIHVATIPALWDRNNRAAGPIRNGVMLWLAPDAVIAFHWDLAHSSRGTADCVRKARKADIKVIYIKRPQEVAMPSTKYMREKREAKKRG